jgi:hypothetical protein
MYDKAGKKYISQLFAYKTRENQKNTRLKGEARGGLIRNKKNHCAIRKVCKINIL